MVRSFWGEFDGAEKRVVVLGRRIRPFGHQNHIEGSGVTVCRFALVGLGLMKMQLVGIYTDGDRSRPDGFLT